MKTILNCLFFLLCFYVSLISANSQIIFYNEIYRGGVTCGGFSSGFSGGGIGELSLHYESGSLIKKAYLFSYSIKGSSNSYVKLNNKKYFINDTNKIVTFSHKNTFFSPINLHVLDVTNDTNITNHLQNIVIEIPWLAEMPEKGIYTAFLFVAYENQNLPVLNSTIIINDKNMIGNETYNLNLLNSINDSNPVGFSLYSDRSGGGNIENKKVFVNNNLIGTIGGSDSVNKQYSYGGVKGHFYYQNNQLFGLDDDYPNNIMEKTDGLADISSHTSNNSNSLDINLKHINYPNQPGSFTNINLAFFLAYTTPCDTFSASVSRDTLVCAGQPLPLQASGGVRYEWLPQLFLSCYDCPNPVFTGDSTITYTVRIWNNDSCSKVLPMRVQVRPAPKITAYTLVPPLCGSATGQVSVS